MTRYSGDRRFRHSGAGLRCLVPDLFSVLIPLISAISGLRPGSHQTPEYMDTPGFSVEYFPVHGKTPEEVREYLLENGAVGMDGRRYHAYVEWHIFWKWPVRDNRPEIGQVEATSSIKLHLPRWEEVQSGSPDQSSWEKYMKALEHHEKGHINQALYHRKKLEDALKAAAAENPSLSAREANRIARKIVGEARLADETYDLLTAHGLLQGARWPQRRLSASGEKGARSRYSDGEAPLSAN